MSLSLTVGCSAAAEAAWRMLLATAVAIITFNVSAPANGAYVLPCAILVVVAVIGNTCAACVHVRPATDISAI